MEDLFKILVWLIIIISFFSSFFKKKKKETPQKKKAPENYYGNENIPQTHKETLEAESYNKNDIIKEIEKLFKVEAPAKIETKPETHYDNQWHERTASEHEKTASEHTMQTDWDIEKKKIKVKKAKVSSKIEEEAKRFEKFLNKNEEFDRLPLNTIKQKLAYPRSLKEFIVISEILGKPVSLRHRPVSKFL